MKLIFTNQYANLLLLLNGLILLFYLGAKKKKRQRAMKFGNYETLEKVAGRKFLKSSNFVLVTRILAITTLIIGISSPVLVQEVTSSDSDYVIAIDSSASMLNSDIKPTRFKAAKDISTQFVRDLGGKSKVGVISFSGNINKELDLSSDREETLSSIQNIETGNTAGTSIGDALSTASSMLIGSNNSKSVILITDGRNNVGSSVNSSINLAESNNITIYSFGIGSNEGSSSNQDDSRIIDGENVSRADFPNLDQETLYSASKRTGGAFKTVTNRSELESAFISLDKSEEETPFGEPLILLGAALLVLEWILSVTKFSIIP